MSDKPSSLFLDGGAGDSDSDISLTSTQPEEPQDEYTVDRILCHKEAADGTPLYLGMSLKAS